MASVYAHLKELVEFYRNRLFLATTDEYLAWNSGKYVIFSHFHVPNLKAKLTILRILWESRSNFFRGVFEGGDYEFDMCPPPWGYLPPLKTFLSET